MPSRFLGVSTPSGNMEFPPPFFEVCLMVCELFGFLYKMVGKNTPRLFASSSRQTFMESSFLYTHLSG